jgi:hypothetical protein
MSLYTRFLDNICYGDYIDRITFQKQIWKFSELSAIIKIFKNNRLIRSAHYTLPPHTNATSLDNIRFTKILTKYSTEYNNYGFLQDLCTNLNWDIDDVYSYFIQLKLQSYDTQQQALSKLDECGVGILDVNRMFRFLDKYTSQLPPYTSSCGAPVYPKNNHQMATAAIALNIYDDEYNNADLVHIHGFQSCEDDDMRWVDVDGGGE